MLSFLVPARANALVILSSSAKLLGLTIVEVGLLSVMSSEGDGCRVGLSLMIPDIDESNRIQSLNSSLSSETVEIFGKLSGELLSSDNLMFVS